MPILQDKRLQPSWIDQALAKFNADNDALVLRTRSVLSRVVADAGLHGRLINTLSMLEHLGSYKIMATQHSAAIDQPTLKHVAEEAQHAFFMKRQAEKESGRPMRYVDEDLLAPATARMYFQKLEIAVTRLLGRQHGLGAAYLYMSLIVEFRALWFYGLYGQSLKRAGHGMSLKRILGEERHHLGDMAHRLEIAGELSDTCIERFLNGERRFFGRLLGAMQAAAA